MAVDPTAIRLKLPRDDLQHRRFATTVRPNQADSLAFVNVQRHSVENRIGAEEFSDLAERKEQHLCLMEGFLRFDSLAKLELRFNAVSRSPASAAIQDIRMLIFGDAISL